MTNVRRGSFGGYATCRRRRRHHHHRRRRRRRRRCCRITGNRHTLPLSMLSRIGHDPTGVSYTFSLAVYRAQPIYTTSFSLTRRSSSSSLFFFLFLFPSLLSSSLFFFNLFAHLFIYLFFILLLSTLPFSFFLVR